MLIGGNFLKKCHPTLFKGKKYKVKVILFKFCVEKSMFHNKLNAFSYKVFILIPLISMPKLPLDPESTLGIIIVAFKNKWKTMWRNTAGIFVYIFQN